MWYANRGFRIISQSDSKVCTQTNLFQVRRQLCVTETVHGIAISYSHDAFTACCMLAALHHNHHLVDSMQAIVPSTRELRFHRKFNKNSQQGTVKRVKQE